MIYCSSDDDSSDSDSVTSDDLATMSCERAGNAVFAGAGEEQADNDKVFSNATTCSDIAQFDVADKEIPNGEFCLHVVSGHMRMSSSEQSDSRR